MAKLEVGDVNDPLEREADAVADLVMRMPAPSRGASDGIAPETNAALDNDSASTGLSDAPMAGAFGSTGSLPASPGFVAHRTCASCESEGQEDEIHRSGADALVVGECDTCSDEAEIRRACWSCDAKEDTLIRRSPAGVSWRFGGGLGGAPWGPAPRLNFHDDRQFIGNFPRWSDAPERVFAYDRYRAFVEASVCDDRPRYAALEWLLSGTYQTSADESEIRRACAACEVVGDDEIHREAAARWRGGTTSGGFAAQLRSRVRSGGRPLPDSARNFLEPRLGVGLGYLRVYDDPAANSLAKQINARAFTIGSDIFFGSGELKPTTHEGMRLVAHEVAHTLQTGRELKEHRAHTDSTLGQPRLIDDPARDAPKNPVIRRKPLATDASLAERDPLRIETASDTRANDPTASIGDLPQLAMAVEELFADVVLFISENVIPEVDNALPGSGTRLEAGRHVTALRKQSDRVKSSDAPTPGMLANWLSLLMRFLRYVRKPLVEIGAQSYEDSVVMEWLNIRRFRLYRRAIALSKHPFFKRASEQAEAEREAAAENPVAFMDALLVAQADEKTLALQIADAQQAIAGTSDIERQLDLQLGIDELALAHQQLHTPSRTDSTSTTDIVNSLIKRASGDWLWLAEQLAGHTGSRMGREIILSTFKAVSYQSKSDGAELGRDFYRALGADADAVFSDLAHYDEGRAILAHLDVAARQDLAFYAINADDAAYNDMIANSTAEAFEAERVDVDPLTGLTTVDGVALDVPEDVLLTATLPEIAHGAEAAGVGAAPKLNMILPDDGGVTVAGVPLVSGGYSLDITTHGTKLRFKVASKREAEAMGAPQLATGVLLDPTDMVYVYVSAVEQGYHLRASQVASFIKGERFKTLMGVAEIASTPVPMPFDVALSWAGRGALKISQNAVKKVGPKAALLGKLTVEGLEQAGGKGLARTARVTDDVAMQAAENVLGREAGQEAVEQRGKSALASMTTPPPAPTSALGPVAGAGVGLDVSIASGTASQIAIHGGLVIGANRTANHVAVDQLDNSLQKNTPELTKSELETEFDYINESDAWTTRADGTREARIGEHEWTEKDGICCRASQDEVCFGCILPQPRQTRYYHSTADASLVAYLKHLEMTGREAPWGAPKLDAIAVAAVVVRGGKPAYAFKNSVNADPLLRRESFKIYSNPQSRERVDAMLTQAQRGNLMTGKGAKHLFSGISEMRHKNGERIYFRILNEETLEVLALSNKSNQDPVIDRLMELYGKK